MGVEEACGRPPGPTRVAPGWPWDPNSRSHPTVACPLVVLGAAGGDVALRLLLSPFSPLGRSNHPRVLIKLVPGVA